MSKLTKSFKEQILEDPEGRAMLILTAIGGTVVAVFWLGGWL